MPLKREGVNQRRLPSRSQRRGRNVAKSGHVTNGSRGKANAAGKKSAQTAGKKSKASGPAPSPAHMERDLKGKPARRNRRNGQHDTANRPLERKKKQGTSKGRQKPGKQGGKRKASKTGPNREQAEGNTTRTGMATMPASTKYLLRQKSGVLGGRQGSGTGGRSILWRNGGMRGWQGLFGDGVHGLGRVLG